MANDNTKTSLIKVPSAHRAVIYAAGIPGWGELYARAWLQGGLTLSAFLAFLGWFCWLGWQSALLLQTWDGGALNFPLQELGLALAGMLCLWFWGIFNAARTARIARLRLELDPQCSPAWGAFMSWLCPGSGQAYAGRGLFGGLFLLLYLAGLALMLPAYREFASSLQALFSGEGQHLLRNPLLLVQQVKTIFFMLENSLPAVFLSVTKMLAIAAAVELLARQRAETQTFVFEEKTPWYASVEARAAGLFFLGWFAPGAGQLLIGRSYGWYFLNGVAACHVVIAILLRHEFLDVNLAGMLLWIPALLRFAAMLEAPIRLLQQGRRSSPMVKETG